MIESSSVRSEKIDYFFGPNHPEKFDWNKISLVEKERPGTVKKIRALLSGLGIRTTNSNIHSLFDYHPSWSFARIMTGWLYYKQTDKYHELLRLCFELTELHDEIKIVMNHLDQIEFVTESCYVKTPELNAKFERECDYARRFLQVFPRELYTQASIWIDTNKEFINSVDKHPRSERLISVNIEGHPGMRMDDDIKAEQWAREKGCSSHVFFSVHTRKEDALKIKKKLNEDGFDSDMLRVYPGLYRFSVASKKGTGD